VSDSIDSVSRVLDLMRDTFGEAFKTYYDGDPEAIPLFNLPAIIVDQTGDDTIEAAFGQDDVEDRIIIKVVLNKRDDFDNDKVKQLNTTARRIRDIIGKRDPATKNYESKTVKGAVRQFVVEGVNAIAPTMNVEYGINPRPGGEGYADLTAEGHVTFPITYSLNVN